MLLPLHQFEPIDEGAGTVEVCASLNLAYNFTIVHAINFMIATRSVTGKHTAIIIVWINDIIIISSTW